MHVAVGLKAPHGPWIMVLVTVSLASGCEVMFGSSADTIGFTIIGCNILDEKTRKVLIVGKRVKNIYIIDLEEIRNSRVCLVAKYEKNEVDLWHRRLGHLSYHSLKKLVSLKLVPRLPLDLEEKPETCETCIKSKQVKSSFDKKIEISTKRPLELLHMDLFGPNQVYSLEANCVD